MENTNHRKSTKVTIAGIEFYADAVRGGLVEAANPGNVLSIMDMVPLGDHNEFLFDKVHKCIVRGNWNIFAEQFPGQTEYVWVRPLAALDPQGMEHLISQGKAIWTEHYTTPLPVVNIAGHDFYVDPIRKGFRDSENKWNIILFTDMVRDPDGGYHIFFDEKARNVPFPHELDIYAPSPFLPDGISRIPLPDGFKLTEMISTIKTVVAQQLRSKNKTRKRKSMHH